MRHRSPGNDIGLTATHLLSGDGTIVVIPYRVPAHGMLIHGRDPAVTVIITPVCASEDSRFGGWLGQRGIYRIENPSGSLARIGEGVVLDRVRRHRARPPLLPARLVAAFGSRAEWPREERRYLEETFAGCWVAEGNGLTSRVFNRRHLGVPLIRQRQLNAVMAGCLRLIRLGDAVLDNDSDDLAALQPGERIDVPAPPTSAPDDEGQLSLLDGEMRLDRARTSDVFRRFPPGTELLYEDGRISARATARRDAVLLHCGSTVYIGTSGCVGQVFTARHRAFVEAVCLVLDAEIGVTRISVAAASAAFLLKCVTGGRFHNANRWRATS